MALVGDIILDLRRRAPDLPAVLPAPGTLTLTPIHTVVGVLFGTYWVVATALNQWGETIATAEQSVAVTLGNNSFTAAATLPPGATALKVYVGTASGTESVYFTGPTSPLTITSLNGTPSPPPMRNTSFLPDSDGRFWGAYSAYAALKRALDEMIRLGNGITDLTGIQSTIGTPLYALGTVSMPFFNFTNAWFDGYPMDVVQRQLLFERNPATGFSGIAAFHSDGVQPTVELWPQPNRTGGLTTLSGLSPMGATDVVANVASTTGFLSLGLIQIESEIMSYVGGVNQFTNLTRGIGGTIPAAHNSGSTVTELNIKLSGKRLAASYTPGQAATNLNIPPAWESALVLHMLSQFRSAEQDDAASSELLNEFVALTDKLTAGSLRATKPRQVQIGGGAGINAYNVNGVGWGWLIQ